MQRLLTTALFFALLPCAAAQVPCSTAGIDATVSPPVAALGQTVVVTLTNNSASTIQLPSACTYGAVLTGASCSGTPVFQPFCAAVLTPIPPGQSHSMPWDQLDDNGQQVPAGTYSFQISYFDASFTLHGCCPTLTIGGGTGAPYCFGTGCPCGNDDPGAGCANSTGAGALLSGGGSASVSADDLVLTVAGVPANRPGILYMGGAQVQFPFGDGFRCVGAGPFAVCRFPVQNSGPAGVLAQGPGIAAFSQTLGAACAIDPGETWSFQGWFRDPAGPCGGFFNLSNGLSVAFAP